MSPFRLQPLGLWLVGLVLTAAPPAHASEYQEVQKLQADGRTAAALAQADRYIAANPRDPQMRFTKANVLSADGRNAEAEVLLQQLTREYPELAEPWNNLAVLQAAQGQLDEARDALETALRIAPNYATARENLGDVLVRQANQAYLRARQADAANPRLPGKLKALGQVLAPTAGGAN